MVIGHLAHRLGIGVSTGGHLVDKLVQAGLVERTEDSEDRRRTLAQLTPAGEELCAHLFDNMGRQMPSLIREMSEEDQAALLQGLRALVHVIEKKAQAKG
jgi:DNA-binding MarR family transcriptional regulator